MTNVAIVAVHGISDHVPSETARRVADGLLALGGGGAGDFGYEVARETHLRIPVRPIERPRVPMSAHIAGDAPPPGRFEERSDFVLKLHAQRPAPEPSGADHVAHPEVVAAQGVDVGAPEAGHPVIANFDLGGEEGANDDAEQAARAAVANLAGDGAAAHRAWSPFDYLALGFMENQLENYECSGSDRVYETIRVETERIDANARTRAHIYEVYWSDLLRPKMGMTRIFGELYQTLFHLCQLGRQTIDFAFGAHAGTARGVERSLWVTLSATHRWAVRSLTLAVPVLNLFLIALVLLIPAATLPRQAVLFIARVVPIAAFVVVVGWMMLRKTRPRFLVWLFVPFLVTALAFGITNAASSIGEYRALLIEGLLIAAVPVGVAIDFLNGRRPGTWIFTGIMAFFVGIALLFLITVGPNSEYGYVFAILRATELVFGAIVVAWLIFLVFSWLAFIAGSGLVLLVNVRRGTNAAENSRIKRAVATGLLSLSLPAALFLLITLVFYSGLGRVVGMTLNAGDAYPPTQLAIDYLRLPNALHPTDLFNRLLEFSSTPIFLVFLSVLGLAVLIAFWGLFPVVCFDLYPKVFSRSNPEFSGKWLDNGYHALSYAALFLYVAAPTLLSIGVIVAFIRWPANLDIGQAQITKIWGTVGALLVGSAVGLLAFHGRLERLALGFRPLLNSILDIDNYLREFPRKAAPRARICARYASLLRAIQNWRDEQGRPYNRIVIVAHSQGTVISVELLRYLQQNRDPSLKHIWNGDIPIYLLTAGCPLRQLYGWRFPHLYGWARHSTTDNIPAWFEHDLSDDVAPDPLLLGVRQWINAYGSADYVGRHLWRSEGSGYRSTAAMLDAVNSIISSDPSGVRSEFCIGPVAHNQYFAARSLPLRVLDRLVG